MDDVPFEALWIAAAVHHFVVLLGDRYLLLGEAPLLPHDRR